MMLKPLLTSVFTSNVTTRLHQLSPPLPVTRASAASPPPEQQLQQQPWAANRRQFLYKTATISSLSLAAPLIGLPHQAAEAEEEALAEWERVYLPIDPGVVLLDIAFVPDDLNHGSSLAFTPFFSFSPFCVPY